MIQHRINAAGNHEWYSPDGDVVFSHRSGNAMAFDNDGWLWLQHAGHWHIARESGPSTDRRVTNWKDLTLAEDGEPIWPEHLNLVDEITETKSWESWYSAIPSRAGSLVPVVQRAGDNGTTIWQFQLYGETDGRLVKSWRWPKADRLPKEVMWSGARWLMQFWSGRDEWWSDDGLFLGDVYPFDVSHTCCNGVNWAAGYWDSDTSDDDSWVLYNGKRAINLSSSGNLASSFGHGAMADNGTLLYTVWEFGNLPVYGCDELLCLYRPLTGQVDEVATNDVEIMADDPSRFFKRGRPAILKCNKGYLWAWHRPHPNGHVYVESGTIEVDIKDECEDHKDEISKLKQEVREWEIWYDKLEASFRQSPSVSR